MTEKGRIIEIFDGNNVNNEKEPKIKEPITEGPKESKKSAVSELSAKEEMEALAENEELIRDWLDDTI